MKSQKSRRVWCKEHPKKSKKPTYFSPKLVIHNGTEFIHTLGPAQACSPSPGF